MPARRLAAVLRLYDLRTGKPEMIRPAHPGELRVLASAPPCGGEPGLAGLRAWLPPDLIRRCADRRGLMVTVCEIGWPEDEQAAAGLRADRSALNIHPPDRTWPAAEPHGRAVEFVEPGSAGQAPGARHPFDVANGTDDPGGNRQDVAAHLAPRTGAVTFGSGGEAGGRDTVGLRDVTGRGLDPLAVRLAFLGRRYPDPFSISWDVLADADATLRRWRQRVAGWAQSPSAPMSRRYADAVVSAFDDDLDTPAALREMGALEADEAEPAGTKFETFAAMDRLLGLDLAADIGKALTG